MAPRTHRRRPHRRRALTFAALGVVLLVLLGVVTALSYFPAPGSPTRAETLAVLNRVEVIPHRPWVQGYDRAAFGPAWTDDHNGPLGHNGCDTRTDVLRQQFPHAAADLPCTVTTPPATLLYRAPTSDPYTGLPLDTSHRIEIDHVYALSTAWDFGAWQWDEQRRIDFANDTQRNLLATAAQVNQEKSNLTPAQWLPPDRSQHCAYAHRYATIADYWELAISRADYRALWVAAQSCPW